MSPPLFWGKRNSIISLYSIFHIQSNPVVTNTRWQKDSLAYPIWPCYRLNRKQTYNIKNIKRKHFSYCSIVSCLGHTFNANFIFYSVGRFSFWFIYVLFNLVLTYELKFEFETNRNSVRLIRGKKSGKNILPGPSIRVIRVLDVVWYIRSLIVGIWAR